MGLLNTCVIFLQEFSIRHFLKENVIEKSQSTIIQMKNTRIIIPQG